MRKVVLYQLLSLDGVAEEPSDWFTDAGPKGLANLARVIGSQDAILLGRNTYDDWVDYWPTSDVEPFAGFINGTMKHVFTSSTPGKDWPHTKVVETPATDHVARLKQEDGDDIGIHGSIRLASSLWHAGLIDELQLVISPTVAGRGRRLFDDDGTLHRLEFIDLQRSPGGTVFAAYRSAPGDA